MSRHTKNAKSRSRSMPPVVGFGGGVASRNLILALCPCGRSSLWVHKRNVGARLIPCGRKGCER